MVYRLWASLGLGHLRERVEGWLPESVFASDIEEVLTGVGGDQLHVMAAYVIKSCDTVDRSFLDCVLGRSGLPAWFRRTYFAYHSSSKVRTSCLSWCGDGGISQGCPLSMVFTVALYVPWCRYLEPQLYVDNLKCSVQCPRAFFDAARLTARYVRAVGQDVSPGICVLRSTSRSVRKAVKLWDISGDGFFWKVQLDHLDFTWRARAGTLSCRVKEATAFVVTVGALPLRFSGQVGVGSR